MDLLSVRFRCQSHARSSFTHSSRFCCFSLHFHPLPLPPTFPPREAGNRACWADVDKLHPDWSITRELCDFIFHCFWLRSYRSSNPPSPCPGLSLFPFIPAHPPALLSEPGGQNTQPTVNSMRWAFGSQQLGVLGLQGSRFLVRLANITGSQLTLPFLAACISRGSLEKQTPVYLDETCHKEGDQGSRGAARLRPGPSRKELLPSSARSYSALGGVGQTAHTAEGVCFTQRTFQSEAHPGRPPRHARITSDPASGPCAPAGLTQEIHITLLHVG